MLGASETPYDLRFRFLGIPVRVHPLFWLISALLARDGNNIPLILLWTACVFVSILVHEYGHGLIAQAFGSSPSILLYGLGGLCYYQSERQPPAQRLAVVLSGPGAGFLLCGAVLLVASLLFGVTPREQWSVIEAIVGFRPNVEDYLSARKLSSDTAFGIYWQLVFINLMWGLVNLLPIWPLDGGHVSEIILSYFDPAQGTRWSHIVSLMLAGILAVATLFYWSDLFMAAFFAYFAVINYQVLQSIHRTQSMGLNQDQDWWRR